MRGAVWGICALAMCCSGCATTQYLNDEWDQRFVGLESRVATLEQRQVSAEEKVWNVEYSMQQKQRATPTPTPTPASQPTAKKSTDTAMTPRNIQQALKNAGYYNGRIDGTIGPITTKAVKAFQSEHGLKADGVVGSQTWSRLQRHLQ